MRPGRRRRARGHGGRTALIACAFALAVSGVALASLGQTSAPSPPTRQTIVPLTPPSPHAPSRAPDAIVHTAQTAQTNRAAVYQTPPSNPPPSAQATTTQPSIPTPAPPPPPAPILGERGTTTVIGGTVKIRLKGTTQFVSLSGAAAIPNGSEIDATHGRVLITVATGQAGHTATAEVYGGVFLFHQSARAHGLTRLALSLPLTGCPPRSPRGRRHGNRRRKPPARGARHRSGATSRHLWVSEGGGHWGTNGRYVSTSVEGTRWLTLDECDRSMVHVATGTVRVRDLITNRTSVVGAGRTYTVVSR